MPIQEALESLRSGKPVLVFDSKDREGETDIVFASQFITPNAIRLMRKDGGGLICVTMPSKVADILGLDYLIKIYERSRMPFVKRLYPNDIPYGEQSSFSITINHRKTFTGIPDADRALTISKFAEIVEHALSSNSEYKKAQVVSEFGSNFRTPGHVFTLIASKGLISRRKGHTELTIYLAYLAGLIPSTTIVEMLGDDGKSLSKSKAIEYAKKRGFVFLEGKDIIKKFLSEPSPNI